MTTGSTLPLQALFATLIGICYLLLIFWLNLYNVDFLWPTSTTLDPKSSLHRTVKLTLIAFIIQLVGIKEIHLNTYTYLTSCNTKFVHSWSSNQHSYFAVILETILFPLLTIKLRCPITKDVNKSH